MLFWNTADPTHEYKIPQSLMVVILAKLDNGSRCQIYGFHLDVEP